MLARVERGEGLLGCHDRSTLGAAGPLTAPRHGSVTGREHAGILVDAACPGSGATDLNGVRGVRTPQEGAATAIRLATLPDGGPTGGLSEDAGVVPG